MMAKGGNCPLSLTFKSECEGKKNVCTHPIPKPFGCFVLIKKWEKSYEIGHSLTSRNKSESGLLIQGNIFFLNS